MGSFVGRRGTCKDTIEVLLGLVLWHYTCGIGIIGKVNKIPVLKVSACRAMFPISSMDYEKVARRNAVFICILLPFPTSLLLCHGKPEITSFFG